MWGGAEFGEMRKQGFSVAELQSIADEVRSHGGEAELVMVSDALPMELREEHEAATLVLRNGASKLLASETAADDLLVEHQGVRYDRKFWDGRQRKTKNKQARFNVVFGPSAMSASESFEQPTVVAMPSLPYLDGVRCALPNILGEKATGLFAEGNHYYKKDSGIGFHGDAERKIVVCLSLGGTSTLRYQWRQPGSSQPFGSPVDVEVRHGDIYVMSEKATGNDWKLRSKYRVVHGAGHSKYIDKGY